MSTNNRIIIKREQPSTPKFAVIAIVILAVTMTILVVLSILKLTANNTQQIISGEEIISGKEIIIGINNATVYVPKDTATMPGAISITALEANLFSVADSEWIRPQVVRVEYRDAQGILYEHVKFPNPVLVCFKVTEKQWQAYITYPEEYQVQYYDESQKPSRWVALSVVTHPDQYQLCGQTGHLSIFALAVKPGSMIPVTGEPSTPKDSFLTEFFYQLFPAFSPDYVAPTQIPPTATIAPTIAPTATNISTDVPKPTAVDTSEPTAVDTAEPTAVDTAEPTAVDTAEPTAVDTAEPTATDPAPTDPAPTDPPVTDPPATDPPATDPPATEVP